MYLLTFGGDTLQASTPRLLYVSKYAYLLKLLLIFTIF